MVLSQKALSCPPFGIPFAPMFHDREPRHERLHADRFRNAVIRSRRKKSSRFLCQSGVGKNENETICLGVLAQRSNELGAIHAIERAIDDHHIELRRFAELHRLARRGTGSDFESTAARDSADLLADLGFPFHDEQSRELDANRPVPTTR